MEQPLVSILHDFCARQRIGTAVALRIGMNKSTFWSKLKPQDTYANLTNDELLLIVAAIRFEGYADELDGLFASFLHCADPSTGALIPVSGFPSLFLAMNQDMAELGSCLFHLSKDQGEQHLRETARLIRHKLFPKMSKILRGIDYLLANPDS